MSNSFGAVPPGGTQPHYHHYPQLPSYAHANNERCRHYPYYHSNASLAVDGGVTAANTTANGHGRLHKSLSFAFQTPMMMNATSYYPQNSCQQQQHQQPAGGGFPCTATNQYYSR
jgi:hypothetical protein